MNRGLSTQPIPTPEPIPEQELIEAVACLADLFPPRELFEALVHDGAHGDEVHTIRGDDLAAACCAVDTLMKHFNVPRGTLERWAFVWQVERP